MQAALLPWRGEPAEANRCLGPHPRLVTQLGWPCMAEKTNPILPAPEIDLKASKSLPFIQMCACCDHNNVMVVRPILPADELELDVNEDSLEGNAV